MTTIATSPQTTIIDSFSSITHMLNTSLNLINKTANTTGLINLGYGFKQIYHHNYKSAMAHLAEGTLRATATITLSYIAYLSLTKFQDYRAAKIEEETQRVAFSSIINAHYFISKALGDNLIVPAPAHANSTSVEFCKTLINCFLGKVVGGTAQSNLHELCNQIHKNDPIKQYTQTSRP